MWTEEKGRRFEDLRKRTMSLTESERVELQELTTEIEGIETAFMDEDTRRRLLAIGTAQSGSQPVSLWIIGSALIGMMLAMCGGAVHGYLDFGLEPAPILSEEWIMLIAAVFFAPIGLILGTVVGVFLFAAKHVR
jgi:hypothetical protein